MKRNKDPSARFSAASPNDADYFSIPHSSVESDMSIMSLSGKVLWNISQWSIITVYEYEYL